MSRVEWGPMCHGLEGLCRWQVMQVHLGRGPWSLASDWEESVGVCVGDTSVEAVRIN